MTATAQRLEALAQKRAALSAEIAEHRVELGHVAERLQEPLHKVERVRDQLRVARERYAFLLLPVAVLALLKPRATLKLALAAWSLWRSVGPPLPERLPPPRG